MSIPSNVAFLRWAKQASKGTAIVDASSTFGAYLAGGTQPEAARVDEAFVETTGGRMLNDRYVSTVMVSGDPQMYVMPLGFGSLAHACLGASAISGASDPYTHTLTVGTGRPWLTMWRGLGNIIRERFTDCKVDKLVITGQTGKPLMVTATIMGLTPQFKTADETDATIEVTNRFLHYDGAGALKVEGAAVASIDDWTVTISNNGQNIGGDSLTGFDISEGELTVEVAIRQLLLAASFRNRIYYGGATPADNAAAISAITELAGSPAGIDFLFTRSATRTLEILIPRLAVNPYSNQPATSQDPLRDSLVLNALQPSGGATPITIITKSSRATAY